MSSKATGDRVADPVSEAVKCAAAAAEHARLASEHLASASFESTPRVREELLTWLASTLSRLQEQVSILRRRSRGDLAEDLAAASGALTDAARWLNRALAGAASSETGPS